jgi:hypothetical protein
VVLLLKKHFVCMIIHAFNGDLGCTAPERRAMHATVTAQGIAAIANRLVT